jgi:cellulose synthase/poly-beta-1,6-N-acetylglucosamine synthase-like glycosyltransferase
VNLSLWGSAGLLRLLDQRFSTPPVREERPPLSIAIVIPAHNEELVIAGSIGSATRLLPLSDIYVVSDASSDATPAIATDAGANVLHLEQNRGKAGALEAAIEHFSLIERYDAVLFLDADSQLDEAYLVGAQEFLADPDVCAVAGYATIMWRPDELTVTGQIIAAYRDRLYTLQQRLLKYGQTWARVNVAYIAPGFASVYRSGALQAIEMNPPGLIIEDFNMTFQLHRRRVGKIGFSPRIRAAAQDPATLADYISQVRRWTLGFWQTIRFNGFWPSLFWMSLGLVILESLVASMALVGAAVLAIGLALPAITGDFVLRWGPYADAYGAVAGYVTLPMLALAIFGPDLVLTAVMAAVRRRPRYLLLGLAFPGLRLVDAWLALWTLPQAWTARSNGSWRSPARR